MKISVITLDNKAAGDLQLNDAVFGVEVRKDILHRVMEWQRAKARSGTHKTKGISEISGTTKKPHKQKGTGSARAGSKRAPQHRGGATIFGPVVRSHEYSLPKKVRSLGLRIALSAKAAAGELKIIDKAAMSAPKTSELIANVEKMGLTKPLFIGGAELDANFALASRNIKNLDVLPVQGANVLDILRHRELVLTKDAVAALEERLA